MFVPGVVHTVFTESLSYTPANANIGGQEQELLPVSLGIDVTSALSPLNAVLRHYTNLAPRRF